MGHSEFSGWPMAFNQVFDSGKVQRTENLYSCEIEMLSQVQRTETTVMPHPNIPGPCTSGVKLGCLVFYRYRSICSINRRTNYQFQGIDCCIYLS